MTEPSQSSGPEEALQDWNPSESVIAETETVPEEAAQAANRQATAGVSSSSSAGSELTEFLSDKAQERPELAVGAAFAGGFVLAMILKAIGR